jgi:tRNA(fMet)-specific endonuclease VapC
VAEGTDGDARHAPRRGAVLASLILDTSVLVDAERQGTKLAQIVADDDDVAIAAITVAELLVGVELADGKRRVARQKLVDAIIDTLPIEDYDLNVARRHGELLAHARLAGQRRGAHDLVIAATAVARRRIVVTADARGFDGLPGVTYRATR